MASHRSICKRLRELLQILAFTVRNLRDSAFLVVAWYDFSDLLQFWNWNWKQFSVQCRKLEPIATHTRLEFDQRLNVKETNFPVK